MFCRKCRVSAGEYNECVAVINFLLLYWLIVSGKGVINIKSRLFGVLTVFFALILIFAATNTSSVKAADYPDALFDPFNQLILRPDIGSYWWVKAGGMQDGVETVVENQYCALQSCVTAEQEGLTKFVRVKLRPQSTAGFYTISELSELEDGKSFGTPGRWSPRPNHPVVMNFRMRFSENYHLDGTGGAVGSAGVWLWNNPFGSENPFAIYSGFGFNWQTANGIVAHGVTATLVRSTFPVYVSSGNPQINPNDWNLYTIIWSETESGSQNLRFLVNGQEVGSTPMIGGSMQDLSVEVWNDNQRAGILDGNFHLFFDPIPQDQYFDIDFISVAQS